jgi:PrtD family type I secretion system ABC transporter
VTHRSVFDGQRTLILSIVVASFLLNVLTLTAPLYMLQLFSRVMASGSVSTLVVLTIGALVALGFHFLFDTIRMRLASRLGTRLEATHGPVVLTVLVEAASATDRRGAQPMRDLQELRRFVTGPAFIALLDAPWSVLFVGVIFLLHPVLGWIALAGVLVLLLIGILSEITARRPNDASTRAAHETQAVAEEMVRNADVLRAMGATPAQVRRWQARSLVALVSATTVVDRVAFYTALSRFVRQALQIAILGAGVLLVVRGQLSPGLMIAASILLGRAAAPVEQSISAWRGMLAARQALGRLNRLLANIVEGERRLELPAPVGRVSVEGATVVVPERQAPLLFDVGFDLRPGESLGIIGPSGAGKSTLARALVGLQPLSRGHVRLDEAALTDWAPDQLGRHVGFLPQRVELFDGTVAENIAAMDEAADPGEVVAAARMAEVHDLILSLPGGYNAPVGLRGELLSSGQRQRVGLARAFYGERRLIVLDEPNANLDPDGEAALAAAVRNATARGAVVVLVTHRMPILRAVSHVALLQEGRLARFGAAAEVLSSAQHQMSQAASGDGAAKVTPIFRRKGAPA